MNQKNKIKNDELTDPTDITHITRKINQNKRVFVLVIENPPELAGKEFEVESSGIIGRDLSCDITIPEKSVSRRHVFFEPDWKSNKILIKDLNSTNGTHVNGKKITEHVLNPGDILSLGRVSMRFETRTIAEHIVRKRIKRDSEIDSLTLLFNRNFFEIELKKLIIENKKFSLLLIDLDDFKEINDKYGHSEGDKVLREFSKILKSSIRDSDIPARYGGDEIVVILKNAGEDIVEKIAERIKDKSPVSFSYGIAEFPKDGKEKEELIRKADERLYLMKRSKKSKYRTL